MQIPKYLFLVSLCFDALEALLIFFFYLIWKDVSIQLEELEEQGMISKMSIYNFFGTLPVLSLRHYAM